MVYAVNVRYVLNSVDDAISFYTQKLGFIPCRDSQRSPEKM
jgi:hypothetical protein